MQVLVLRASRTSLKPSLGPGLLGSCRTMTRLRAPVQSTEPLQCSRGPLCCTTCSLSLLACVLHHLALPHHVLPLPHPAANLRGAVRGHGPRRELQGYCKHQVLQAVQLRAGCPRCRRRPSLNRVNCHPSSCASAHPEAKSSHQPRPRQQQDCTRFWDVVGTNTCGTNICGAAAAGRGT